MKPGLLEVLVKLTELIEQSCANYYKNIIDLNQLVRNNEEDNISVLVNCKNNQLQCEYSEFLEHKRRRNILYEIQVIFWKCTKLKLCQLTNLLWGSQLLRIFKYLLILLSNYNIINKMINTFLSIGNKCQRCIYVSLNYCACR